MASVGGDKEGEGYGIQEIRQGTRDRMGGSKKPKRKSGPVREFPYDGVFVCVGACMCMCVWIVTFSDST